MFTSPSPRRFALAVALVLFSAVLLAFASNAWAGQITYDIRHLPAYQDGYALSGTITTDGNTGYITSLDITNWSWTATKWS